MNKIKKLFSISLAALFMIALMTSCQQESSEQQWDIPKNILEHATVISYADFKNEAPSSPRKANDTGTTPANSHYILKVLVDEYCDGEYDYVLIICSSSLNDCLTWWGELESNYNEQGHCREYLLDCNDSFPGDCKY